MPRFLDVTDPVAARAAIGAVDQTAVNQGGGGYAAPAIDIYGDSITAQNGGYPPVNPPSGSTGYISESQYASRGYLVYALTMLGHRLRFGTNFGIGGQTTAQIYARIADVLASPNRYVHVYAGINDVGQNVALATTQANLKAIYDELIAAGKIVTTATVGVSATISGAAVRANISPGVTSFTSAVRASSGDVLVLGATGNTETVTVASASGSSGNWTINLTAPTTETHSAGDPFRNTTRLGRLHALNKWIVDYCQGRYLDPATNAIVVNEGKTPYLVDWHSLVADPATGKPLGALQPDGTITTVSVDKYATLVDGTHPGQDMAHRMGHALAVVLDRIVPPLPIMVGDNSDDTNIAPNPRCVGDGGSGLAPNFFLNPTIPAGLLVTTTKVARTDGIPGEMQQVSLGPGNTGTLNFRVCDVEGLTFTGDDYYMAEVEFETDSDLVVRDVVGMPLRMRMAARNDSGEVGTAVSHLVSSVGDGAGSIWPAEGIMKNLPFKVPASANRLQVFMVSDNVDTGTYRIKSVRVRKVTP